MDKEELIDLWMAQGYLNAEEDEEIEMIGEEYFNILATRSFFQEFEIYGADGEYVKCKMHDIVHDFAQFVSSKECLWLEISGTKESVINSFGDKVRHLGLKLKRGASFPMSIHGLNRLRTLLISDEFYNLSLSSSNLAELFSKLACLRALVIKQFYPNRIREIPENVGKLIHLKFLNLSRLAIERLPETLCELYNLQKLDIRRYEYLRELPAGIGKLKNIRSLLNARTPLKHMPIGIARLTSLRTLDRFVVGGDVDGSSTSRLESLKNLQLLRDYVIDELSSVSHLDEAERLELHNMENLLRLCLVFDGGDEDWEDEEEEDAEVVEGLDEEGRRKNEKLLEALQPPLNVEELRIVSYGGNIFPKWLTSLTNLRELKLLLCFNCERLPPLGKLPLEKLQLKNLKSVKRVGNEFLGIEESSEDGPSSSSSSPSVFAFPKLKSLEIHGMEELEEWNYRITMKENISIMPRLSFLEVSSCNKLKALPDYLLQTTALQELSICSCDLLEELPILEDRRTTDIPRLTSLWISDCPNLKVLPDYLLQTLQLLIILGCDLLEEHYREGKGEDLQKISHIPHIKWSP
ncbi:putative disease resistance protein RGA4 [Citrus clementina]|uniref:putative disease resistance protein RGA4 n=1 Tax=Citrus clementina TaxID=85681 RepID=UPI000CED5D10|nr:putative disease resistance protein RGA4 [Citrus x clementina]